ncbi:MAG: hypothetical protein IJL91_07305 [Bacteroidales bacterium]|nr:hypothetical protein [Bacteroidales bacterium]
MVKRLRILVAAVAMVSAIQSVAQVKGGWFLPDISASIYLIEGYKPAENELTSRPLTAVGATFGKDSKVQLSIAYDVIQSKFMGMEALFRIDPRFRIRAGIQRMVFLHETTYSPSVLEAIGFSQGASLLGGYSGDLTGINSRSRDCGILAEGDLVRDGERPVLSYWAGVFNGNGYSFKDNNRSKDFQGKILFAPWQSLKFSLGVMKAKYSPILEDGSYDRDILLRRDRMTAGIWGDWGNFFLFGENIYGRTGDSRNECAFLLGGFRPKANLAFSARMDYSDASIGGDVDDRILKPQACFTHFLKGTALSYRIQYGRTIFGDPEKEDYGQISFCLILKLGMSLKDKPL